MIHLPDNKDERIALVRKLFNEFKSDKLNDTKCVKAVVDLLDKQIGERTIWGMKKVWEANQEYYAEIEVEIVHEEDIERSDEEEAIAKIDKKKQSKNQEVRVKVPKTTKPVTTTTKAFNEAVIKAQTVMFGKSVAEIEWLDPNKDYTPEQIKSYVTKVCNEMTIGALGFMHILDRNGITYHLWNKWIDTDDSYRLMFERAREQQGIVYNNRIQDSMKKIVMMFLNNDELVEETIQYEFVKEVDPDDPNKVDWKEEPRARFVRKKPQKPDATTIKLVMDMVKQTMAAASAAENDDMKTLMAMNEIEMAKMLEDLYKEREKRNATGKTDERTAEQTD